MGRTPGSTKENTHERIVEIAARAIRERGYAGVSVAEVMKEAGLTHGGFYAHFASREAMLEQALEHARADGLARLITAGELAKPDGALDAIVATYLSDQHVAHPEAGCSLAAIGTETARQSRQLRRVSTRQVAAMARLLGGRGPGDDRPPGDHALAMLSGLVGAIVLARLVDDPALSKRIRGAVARSIKGDAMRRRVGRRRPAPKPRPAREYVADHNR